MEITDIGIEIRLPGFDTRFDALETVSSLCHVSLALFSKYTYINLQIVMETLSMEMILFNWEHKILYIIVCLKIDKTETEQKN